MNAGDLVLVTGGAGMIGSSLVKRLVHEGLRVKVVDNLWRGKIEYLLRPDGRCVIDMSRDFHQLDLAATPDLDRLLEGVDYIVHLADIVAGIGYVFKNQGSIFRQNILINSNVLNAARSCKSLRGLVYVGTACSFPAHLQSGVDSRPLREQDQYPASPESAYGWSKLMGEYEAQLLSEETGLPVSIPVLHNVYGAPCDYGEGRGQVIPSLVRKAIRHPAEEFIVWGSGSQGRAFIHVDDVVEGLMLSLQRGLGHGVIQLGPDICTSIREVAEAVVAISGKEIDVKFDTTKPEGDRGRCADFAKARAVLGWRPRVGLRDGLENLYDWVSRDIGRAAR